MGQAEADVAAEPPGQQEKRAKGKGKAGKGGKGKAAGEVAAATVSSGVKMEDVRWSFPCWLCSETHNGNAVPRYRAV